MTTVSSEQISLEMNLKELKLPMMLKMYSQISREAVEENLGYEQYLNRLIQYEVDVRLNNRIKHLLSIANFPRNKLISDFQFDRVKAVKKEVIVELCQGHFLSDHTNIILYGNPGAGKTHLVLGIGRELCLKGFKVIFFTGCQLIQELIKAKNNQNIMNFLKKLRRFDLVIIDELGFIPLEKGEGDLLFQFISDRYERGSIIITSNLVFSQWDNIFKDPITTAAAVDRIIHHAILFDFTEDSSYRTKVAQKRLQM